MNVKYYLSDGKKDCTIRACFIADRNHQFKVQIPFKIEAKYWDHKNQIAKKKMYGFHEFNESLNLYRLELLKQIRLMNLSGIDNWEEIKAGIKKYVKSGDFKSHKTITISNGIDIFIIARSNEYKSGTIRKYHILKALLNQFENNYAVILSTINLDYSLVEKFRQYVLYDRENRNDTAYRMLAALKCVIRWLIKNGYEVDPGTLKVSQPVKNKYDIVTLSEDEISQISSANISIEQQRVRDCFLFQIYTGQRCSSFMPILKTHARTINKYNTH